MSCKNCGMSDDLGKVHHLAGVIIQKVGDKNFKSFVPFYDNEYNRVDTAQHKLANEKRITKLIKKHTRITRRYLKKHKNDIKIIADALYNKGTLTYNDIYNLLNITSEYKSEVSINKAVAYASKK